MACSTISHWDFIARKPHECGVNAKIEVATQAMNFDPLCQQIGYFFKDPQLLTQACTHKSFINEQALKGLKDNERLEFLGDAVLDLVMSDLLMERFPELPEGGLTKLRAGLVNDSVLSEIAQAIDLGHYLFVGRGEELTGGRQKKSILSSALEALIAAVYLDSRQEGMCNVQHVVHRLFAKEIPEEATAFLSYKTELQEFVQKRLHTVASYALTKASGPDHQKEFEVIAVVDGTTYGRGNGNTKKQAEQQAAKEALTVLESLAATSDHPFSQGR